MWRIRKDKKTSDFGFFCRSGKFFWFWFFGTRAGAPAPGYGMKLAENALTGSLLTADNKNTASVVVLIQHCLFRGISCGQQGPHKFAAKAGPRYSHHMPPHTIRVRRDQRLHRSKLLRLWREKKQQFATRAALGCVQLAPLSSSHDRCELLNRDEEADVRGVLLLATGPCAVATNLKSFQVSSRFENYPQLVLLGPVDFYFRLTLRFRFQSVDHLFLTSLFVAHAGYT